MKTLNEALGEALQALAHTIAAGAASNNTTRDTNDMNEALKSIASNTFTSALIEHGSWGGRALGAHESTMELYDTDEPTRGLIEWDIPSIDGGESIGLWYELRDGVRHLTDYDGVCDLPSEAIALLERAGIVVDEEFK